MQNPAAVPALIDASRDEDWVVRVEVAGALGRIDHPRARTTLKELQNDCNATVRRRARRALRSSEDEFGYQQWIEKDRSDVDLDVIEELQGLGLAADEFGVNAAEMGIEVLRDVIDDVIVELGDHHVRIRVDDEDIELGTEEVKEVLAQLDERFTRWSAKAIADMQERKVALELRHAARRAREDAERASRRAQIEYLEALADLPDGRGVPQLKEIAREHDDPRIRQSAVALLKTIGHPRARRALHDLH
jgi:HEAT repeat protein